MFKFENDLFTLLNDDMFQVWKNNYNLRPFQKIVKNKKNLLKMGPEVLPYRASQLWCMVGRCYLYQLLIKENRYFIAY